MMGPDGRPLGIQRVGRHQYHPSDFAVLRTPLFPWERLLEWGGERRAARAVGQCLADGGETNDPTLRDLVSQERETLRRELVGFFQEPEVREALLLGSADLESRIDGFLEDPGSASESGFDQALTRYFLRLTSRPTPFGLFAGCSLCQLADHNEMRLLPRSRHKRHSRLDMDFLTRFMEQALADPALRAELRFYPNDSIYRVGGRLRYVESRVGGRGRSHHLVSVMADPFLELVLEEASQGRRPGELGDALRRADPELGADEVRGYVDAIIDSQLLVPQTDLSVTGDDPFGALLDQLAGLPAGRRYHQVLGRAREDLRKLDESGIGSPTETYRSLAQGLSAVLPRFEQNRLVQVDLWKPVETGLFSADLAREVLRAVGFLQQLVSRPLEGHFDAFKTEFQSRYDDREVPLAVALDEEWGIGFKQYRSPVAEGSPLLAGIPFDTGGPDRGIRFQLLHGRLLKALNQAIATGAREIELQPDEWQLREETEDPLLPDSFTALVSIAAAPDGTSSGEIFLDSVAGPPSTRLLGRFCHLDEGLNRAMREDVQVEETWRPDALYAEIVHLPEGRTGNIIFRPVLRDYEIPFLGRAGVDREHQIPVSDLMVSVRGNRVVLRSKRLDREILPRLSTAHVYWKRSVGIYKFLGFLQNQDHDFMPQWDWGPLESASYLPRVRVGKVILALARWLLVKEDLGEVTSKDPHEAFCAIQEMRHRLGWPRFIQVDEVQSSLVIDLDNVLCVDVLAKLLKKRSFTVLKEFFPTQGRPDVLGPGGSFCNELVIPYRRVTGANPPPPATSSLTAVEESTSRSFVPGSEWMFVKLYCGTLVADQILHGAVRPAVEEILSSNLADRWHFLRYSDPNWHLRLRFHGKPEALLGPATAILNRYLMPFLTDGSLWKIQHDTYERELLRYGGEQGIEVAEDLFCRDSRSVLDILGETGGDLGADARWLLCMLGIDTLLGSLGLDTPQKLAVMDVPREAFWREFSGHKRMRKALNEKYRQHRAGIQCVLSREAGAADAADPLVETLLRCKRIWQNREEELRQAGARLVELAENESLAMSLPSIAVSLVHMHCNRMFRSSARAHELVVYDFLCREYISAVARSKKKN